MINQVNYLGEKPNQEELSALRIYDDELYAIAFIQRIPLMEDRRDEMVVLGKNLATSIESLDSRGLILIEGPTKFVGENQ
jgi:hypothetical protein